MASNSTRPAAAGLAQRASNTPPMTSPAAPPPAAERPDTDGPLRRLSNWYRKKVDMPPAPTPARQTDGRASMKTLALVVLVLSGGALGSSLFASTPVFMRTVLLLAPSVENVKNACRRLEHNQICLALASLATLIAGAVAGAAVIVTVLHTEH